MEDKLSLTTFDSIKDKFVKVCNEETFQKEASFAIQHLNRNSYLAGSTRKSILEAVYNVSLTGLSLNPISKLAYLVPRYVNKEVVCCLEPSYQGLCKLATDTGSVKSIYAHFVKDGDVFEQILGTSPQLIHKPKLGNKGNLIAVYAVAILKDDSKQIEVMDISEVNDIRDKSESYKSFKSGKSKSCIWEDHYEEMSRKTVIKRLVKYLPKTDQFDKLNEAVELDNQDYKASYGQLDMIDTLLRTSSISEEKKQFISNYMNTYNSQEASDCISELKEKQIDMIDSGEMVSQTQIKEKLKQF